MEQKRAWLSLEETANLLKVGVPTVQSLINRGLLRAQRGTEPSLVSYDSILAFLREDQHTLLGEKRQPPDLGLISDEPEAPAGS
jgi:hypothetical protein